jgi:Mn-dependent DtxR family transcriptional regulator
MTEEKYRRVISVKEIAEAIGVKNSTVRKYVMLLEEKGYVFEKVDKKRMYSETDLAYLRQFKQLIESSSGGITLSEAANTVAERFLADNIANDTARHATGAQPHTTSELEAKVDKLLEYIEHQDERFEQQQRFNRELISKLDEQQKYISESLEKHDQQLMTSLRENQEAKKIRIESAIAAEEEKKESRGFFSKLFGK